MVKPYAMVFEPILKEKVWGSRRLERYGKPLPSSGRFGESWEIADLEQTSASGGGGGAAISVIANGPLEGKTIADAIAMWGAALLGEDGLVRANAVGEQTHAGRPVFPLLIKYLDAGEHLSVQVHPSPEYADANPGAHLKTESWFIVEAEPTELPDGTAVEPRVFVGLEAGVNEADFRERIATGSAAGALAAMPARAGDCHTLPSGTVHALGGGVLVAEVQTPSDTTFRVYDWTTEYDRADRELHIDQAVACIDFATAAQVETPAHGAGRAAETPYYTIDAVEGSVSLHSAETSESHGGTMAVVMVTAGRGTLVENGGAAGAPVPLSPGTTVLVPAAIAGCVELRGGDDLRALVIRLGSHG